MAKLVLLEFFILVFLGSTAAAQLANDRFSPSGTCATTPPILDQPKIARNPGTCYYFHRECTEGGFPFVIEDGYQNKTGQPCPNTEQEVLNRPGDFPPLRPVPSSLDQDFRSAPRTTNPATAQ